MNAEGSTESPPAFIVPRSDFCLSIAVFRKAQLVSLLTFNIPALAQTIPFE